MAGYFERRRERIELKEGLRAFKPIRNVRRNLSQDEIDAGDVAPVHETWKIFGEQDARFKELFFKHLFHKMSSEQVQRIRGIEGRGLTPDQLAKVLAHDANGDYFGQVVGPEGNSEGVHGLHAATLHVAKPILGKNASNVLKVILNRNRFIFQGKPKVALIDGLLNSIDEVSGQPLIAAIDAALPPAPRRPTPPPRGGTPGTLPPVGVSGDATDEVRAELERITAPRTLKIGALAYRGIETHPASSVYAGGRSADAQKSAVGRLLHDARSFAARMHLSDVVHMSQEAPDLANAALNARSASDFIEDLKDIGTRGRQRQKGARAGILPHELEEHVWNEDHKLWDSDGNDVTAKFHLGNIGSLRVGADAAAATKLTESQRQTVAYLLLAKLAKYGDKEKAPDELVTFTRNAHNLHTTDLTNSIEHDLDNPVIEPEHLLDAVGHVALEMRKRQRGA